MALDQDSLFATNRTVQEDARSVIVVGLPRSGSSFLSHVLSQIPDWYVFDDLYTYRAARLCNALKTMDDEKLRKILHFLGWQIRARLRFGLYAMPEMVEDEVEDMNEALFDCFSGQGASWLDLQEEWLARLAARRGCANWGYKMPGAFRHLDMLFEAHPNMKAVFLMREPHQVLSSYKHMPKDHEDGDPAQYHPLVYAWYWRAAARAWLRAKERHPDRVMLIRFHDLVRDPQASANEMAQFLDATIPENVTAPEKPNSSFTGGSQKRPDLTALEAWITKGIAGSAAKELGFSPKPNVARHHVSDYLDLGRVTWRFSRKQLQKVLRPQE